MIPVRWGPRAQPLAPVAAAGRGDVARRLGERVLAAPGAWRVIVGDRLIVVLGADLPWVDGITYLGGAPEAPRLLHDCRLAPSVPGDLLARAVERSVPGFVAWLHDPDLLVPLAEAEPVHPPALAAWLR
ncbi:MAG: hypothetical protein H6737_00250 [Alphaproteobacteria bacterium]|nr:hypothetical protein [Alphaproteobacteria bacterium]